jgi:hypothetical protein
MKGRKSPEKETVETLKEKLIMEQGWFVPILHEKYLRKENPQR